MRKRLGIIALVAFGAMMVHAPIAEASSEVTDFGSIEGLPVSEDSLSSELLLRGAKTAFMSGGGDGYRIVGEWDDKNGRRVVMRERARSKIQSKHGLSANAPRVVTQYAPKIETFNGGDRVEYRLPMDHIRCEGWGPARKCRKLETRDVLAVVGFNKVTDGRPYGVVTTYCPWVQGRCPDWVVNSPQLK